MDTTRAHWAAQINVNNRKTWMSEIHVPASSNLPSTNHRQSNRATVDKVLWAVAVPPLKSQKEKLQRNSLQSLVKEFLQGAAVFYKDGLCKDIGC